MQGAKRGRRLEPRAYVEGVLEGNRAVLAQAITLVESARAEDEDLAQDVLEGCLPHTGKSVRVGITGVPGAGKSTLIEALGMHLVRDRGQSLAVLAIDPSSKISRGSILGDKTRMAKLANEDRAFIRPSPSSGSLGGVARRTRETMLLCEAAGYRNIIVETVGVGQSETAVRSMVDFFLLLMLSGGGDELQGMKRGIFEMTDLIAVNKADGDNQRAAQQARRELEGALHLFPAAPMRWPTRVVMCSGLTGDGVLALWDAALEHERWMKQNGWFERARREQIRSWMYEAIESGLIAHFRRNAEVRERLPALEREVVEGRLSSFRAARRLLEIYLESKI